MSRMPMRRLIVAALARTARRLWLVPHLSNRKAGRRRQISKIRVATTISTLNSFVQGVGGEHVIVKNIVPIGASPETFAAGAAGRRDRLPMRTCLVENGAGLETWLDRLLRDAGSSGLRVVVCADGLPVKNLNPHLWMDPVLRKELRRQDSRRADRRRSGACGRRTGTTPRAYDARLDALTEADPRDRSRRFRRRSDI